MVVLIVDNYRQIEARQGPDRITG